MTFIDPRIRDGTSTLVIYEQAGAAIIMVPRIKRALHMRGFKIVLFAWGADDKPRLRNVAALRPDGSTEWTAELPADTGNDCFVKLEAVAGTLLATTFSGHRLSLCPATGVRLD